MISNDIKRRKSFLNFFKLTFIYRIFSNLIRTGFCRFLKRKKKLVRGSNPHLWEGDGEDKDDSDRVKDNVSVMSADGESDE